MPKKQKKTDGEVTIEITDDAGVIADALGPDLCLALSMCADSKPPKDDALKSLRERGLVEFGTLMLTEFGIGVLDTIEARYCTVGADYSFERCELTEAENIEYGKRLANAHNEIRRHETELQAYKDQKKAEVSACDAEINALSTSLGNGFEVRRVDVEVCVDRLQNRYTKTRKDTGEILTSRPLQEFEKQLPLPGTAPQN